jgi:hypothetical protein
MMKTAQRFAAAMTACTILLGMAAIAAAEPTQEEVFQSINDNVRSSADWTQAVPYLLVVAGLIIMCLLLNYHLKHRKVTRKSNNPAKLSREVCRRINLRSVELRQLKVMAEEQEVEYPLTLILCPSLLGKAIRSPNAKVDRVVVKEMVARLRQGLAEKP